MNKVQRSVISTLIWRKRNHTLRLNFFTRFHDSTYNLRAILRNDSHFYKNFFHFFFDDAFLSWTFCLPDDPRVLALLIEMERMVKYRSRPFQKFFFYMPHKRLWGKDIIFGNRSKCLFHSQGIYRGFQNSAIKNNDFQKELISQNYILALKVGREYLLHESL